MTWFLIFIFPLALHARDLDKQYEKAQFSLGKAKIEAYVADTESKRSEGLMFIEQVPENTGMLFIFDSVQPLSFWMKNTVIPLSIGFFNNRGVLIDVQEMKVADSLLTAHPPSYQSRAPGLFALEMNEGWFAKHHVDKGAQLKLISSSKSSLLKKSLNP